jgi:hydroxyethylthiazole kinase-like uncharacterized protein yjeF
MISGLARSAPVPLLTADEMRAWDALAIERLAVPGALLMENAGRAAAAVVARRYPDGRVIAAVGGGNNGGDAIVLLRTLRAWGREVAAVPVGAAEMPGDLLRGWEVPVAADPGDAARGAAVVVDGILGTGARGPLRESAAAAVRAMNAAAVPVVALDGPTGVDLTDGSTRGEAVRAELTLTFGAAKRGLLLHPGRAHAGAIVVLEIGLPPLPAGGAGAGLVTSRWAADRLPRIAPDAHKGSVGEVAVLAGGPEMAGAAILVAAGALRSGAGMVRVISPEQNRMPINAALPEAIFAARGSRAAEAALERADALVVGPGIGIDDAAVEALGGALAAGRPAVLDADALTLLARDPSILRPDDAARTIITPHPGEMARLLGTTAAAITADPFAAATEIADRFGCTVLLKGPPSMVAAPGAPVLVNTTGHAGVATGGMGDTLAGVAGAMLAAGAPPYEAAALALFYAGRAAELAGRGRGLLPRDVAAALPRALLEGASRRASHREPGVLLEIPPAT